MTKRIVTCGILAALAIIISSLEQFIPVWTVIPLPGIKLGISNCIILFALSKLRFPDAFAIVLCKCIVVSALFSGTSGFVYSVTGGILSIIVMFVLMKAEKAFSIFGISVAGAASHNFGQILAAALMLGNMNIFNYLPILLIISIFTGTLNAIIAKLLIKRINL